MASRPGRGRNSRMHFVNPRNEHDNRGARPSTSRGGGSYPDRFNKKVTFKANNRGGPNHFRKSWDNKTELVREQLDNAHISANPNRNVPHRNNSGRRHYSRGGGNHYRNSVLMLKESNTGWYSIFVPNVEDGDEVLKIIQTYISPITFYPYNKQFFDNALRFVIDDFKIAKTLHNTSYKITLRDGRKLIIRVNIYMPPRATTIFTPVSNEIRGKIEEVINTRYNPSTKSMDLSRFYECPLFTENQLFVPLNRPSILLVTLNMVAQSTKFDLYGLSLENNHIYMGEGLVWIRRLFPDLKVLDLAGNKFSDLKELKCLECYPIEVINLSRNPVCDTEDKERYRQDVQQLFPALNKLDNIELPSRYSDVIGVKLKMPINLGNSFPVPENQNPEQPDPLKVLVLSFLEQYYERYDNKLSRQVVAEAYHENATFTLSSCFLSCFAKGSLSQYLGESRNLLKPDKNRKSRLIHKGRENIVNFLDKLPKTKHDTGSFVVDVPLANAQFIQIVVNGVFAEDFKEINYRPVFRSFSRTFNIVPVGSGWSLLSDMLFVTVVSDELLSESAKRFYVLRPRPVLSKKINASHNNNATMFIEDSEEMTGLEESPSQCHQDSTPNYSSLQFQQATFSTSQSPSMTAVPINSQQQQPPSYHTSLPISVVHNQQQVYQQNNQLAASSAEPVSFQSTPQQINSSFYMFNNTSPTTFPASSAHTSMPANQPTIESPTDSNVTSNDKLILIKKFSNESGMNTEWAYKCLEENGWNYDNAALCFSKLKANIPAAAFTQTM